MKRRLTLKPVFALGIRIAALPLQYAAQIIIARYLGLTDYGRYASIMIWTTTATSVNGLGFSNAILRFCSPLVAERRISEAFRLLWLCLQQIAAAGIVVILASSVAGLLLRDEVRWLLIAVISVVGWASSVVSTFARAIGVGLSSIAPELLARPAATVIATASALALDHEASLLVPAGAFLCGGVLAAILAGRSVHLRRRALRRHLPHDAPSPACTSNVEEAFVASGRVNLVTLVLQAIARFGPRLVLALRLGPEHLAILYIGLRLSDLTGMSQFLVNYQYAPKLAVASKRGDVRKFFFLVRRSCLFQFSVTVFIAIALFAGSEFTLTMMGKDFEDALLITYLLLLRNVVFSLFGPVATLLNMAGLERQMAVVNAVSAVVAILATAIIVLFTANAVYLLIALSVGDAARLPLAWFMLARSYGGPALRAAIFSSGGRRDQ